MAKGFMTRRYGVEYARPDGATATPIDNYSTWLACAGIPDTFGSLANVIGSTSARITLCNNLNALRYMVRSTTTIFPAVRANSGWITALDSSTYSIKVPTMTSNTAPSGVASGSAPADSRYFYHAFDKDNTTYYHSTTAPKFLRFQFPTSVNMYRMTIKGMLVSGASHSPKNFTLRYSDNGADFTTVASYVHGNNANVESFDILATELAHPYWEITNVDNYFNTNIYITELEYYGLNLY